eukprot:GILK01001479.1.p1 GENE.GILK01001479.1~~GILK01001479.1.p1  ORF type:complete len:257 (+),score=38.23 GILK01001479.1:36-773(+)
MGACSSKANVQAPSAKKSLKTNESNTAASTTVQVAGGSANAGSAAAVKQESVIIQPQTPRMPQLCHHHSSSMKSMPVGLKRQGIVAAAAVKDQEEFAWIQLRGLEVTLYNPVSSTPQQVNISFEDFALHIAPAGAAWLQKLMSGIRSSADGLTWSKDAGEEVFKGPFAVDESSLAISGRHQVRFGHKHNDEYLFVNINFPIFEYYVPRTSELKTKVVPVDVLSSLIKVELADFVQTGKRVLALPA